MKEDVYVTLVVYNLLGQKVRTLVDEFQGAAYREIEWDGRNDYGEDVSSGVYLYKINAGSFVDIQKMIIMR